MFCEDIFNLAMTRHWLLLTSPWIQENIVATAMPEQNATGGQQLAHQLIALHRAMSFIWNAGGTSSSKSSR